MRSISFLIFLLSCLWGVPYNAYSAKDDSFGKVVYGSPGIYVSDWNFGDTATIVDFKVQPDENEISTDTSWGTEGFRYNKKGLTFPIKLAQGEYIEFNGQFKAVKGGNATAMLTSVSDAESEVSSIWAGNGIIVSGPAIIVNDARFGSVIRDTTTTRTIEIKNIGTEPLIITNYTQPHLTQYQLNITREISVSNPLVLQPNETWSFDVDFNATAETRNSFIDTIVFNSNAIEGDSIAKLKVDSVVITGVKDFSGELEKLELYPNPADKEFDLNFSGIAQKPVTILIYNSYGNAVYLNKNIDGDNLKINTSSFPSGMYFPANPLRERDCEQEVSDSTLKKFFYSKHLIRGVSEYNVLRI